MLKLNFRYGSNSLTHLTLIGSCVDPEASKVSKRGPLRTRNGDKSKTNRMVQVENPVQPRPSLETPETRTMMAQEEEGENR